MFKVSRFFMLGKADDATNHYLYRYDVEGVRANKTIVFQKGRYKLSGPVKQGNPLTNNTSF